MKKIAACDCPYEFGFYSKYIEKLKSMVDIKPTLAPDFTVISEKFPCNMNAVILLTQFVSKLVFFKK